MVFATIAIAGPVGQRLGAPHVRHRPGAAAVLRDHVDAHRRARPGSSSSTGSARCGAARSTFDTPMLWSLGFLVTFLFGGLTGVILRQPGARLPRLRHLLRRRPLPLRGVRHRRLRDVRRVLLLVAQVHRPDARRAPRQDPLLDALHRLPDHLPRSSTCSASRACPAATPTTCPRTASSRQRRSPPLGAFLLGRRRPCRSSTTSGEPGATPSTSRSTTPGATARPSSGPPPARRRDTTSAALPRIRSERPAFDLHHPEAAPPAEPQAGSGTLGAGHRSGR